MEGLRDAIRRRSRALGLTQQALAERAGVHVRQIRRYESGEQQPALGVAVRLAAALGLTLDELAGVAPDAAVDGDWWAARQIWLDGKEMTVALPVRLTRHGSAIELEALEGGAWRGELRLWAGPTLTGWYAGPGTRGTMLLALRADGVAHGRWVGVAGDGVIVTGHAALARSREQAQRTVAILAA